MFNILVIKKLSLLLVAMLSLLSIKNVESFIGQNTKSPIGLNWKCLKYLESTSPPRSPLWRGQYSCSPSCQVHWASSPLHTRNIPFWRACNLTAFIHSSTGSVVHLFASSHEGPWFNPQGVLMWNRDSPVSAVSRYTVINRYSNNLRLMTF